VTCAPQFICRCCGNPFAEKAGRHVCQVCELLEISEGESAQLPPSFIAGSSSEPPRLITSGERGAAPRPATSFSLPAPHAEPGTHITPQQGEKVFAGVADRGRGVTCVAPSGLEKSSASMPVYLSVGECSKRQHSPFPCGCIFGVTACADCAMEQRVLALRLSGELRAHYE
jgi:hypothetical protein